MQGVLNYFFAIVVASILLTALEAMLPSGNLKKFVSMVMGLVMIGLILGPLLAWLG